MIERLSSDSRRCAPGVAFLAYPGEAADGRAHIGDAIRRGASAVLWDDAGFAWRDGMAISFQFHPEMSPAFAAALYASRRDRIPDVDAAIASLEAPSDSARIGAWINRFLSEPQLL